MWNLLLVAALAPSAQQPRYEVSGQLVVNDTSELESADFGFGGRVGFRASPLFTFEGELGFFPSDIPDRVPVTASRLEGLFGAKIGPRFERFSVFGSIRPGFVRFAEAPEPFPCILIYPPPLGCVLGGGKTVFALDLGGGFEIEPRERFLLRFDLSDRMLRYPGPAITRDLEVESESFWEHDLRFAVGAGLRF
jgi:hypothetical protein